MSMKTILLLSVIVAVASITAALQCYHCTAMPYPNHLIPECGHGQTPAVQQCLPNITQCLTTYITNGPHEGMMLRSCAVSRKSDGCTVETNGEDAGSVCACEGDLCNDENLIRNSEAALSTTNICLYTVITATISGFICRRLV